MVCGLRTSEKRDCQPPRRIELWWRLWWTSGRINHPRLLGMLDQEPSGFVERNAMCRFSHCRLALQQDRLRCDEQCTLAPIARTLPRAFKHSSGPERAYRGLSADRERGLRLSPPRAEVPDLHPHARAGSL